eukprot:scaffold521234_cov42-Prasinocladus_malaysianus.AAC.1
MTIKPQPGVNIKRVRTDFRQECMADGSRTVFVGDLYSEEQKDILIELDVAEYFSPADLSDQNPNQQLLNVEVKYYDVANTKSEEANGSLYIQRPNAVVDSDLKVSELVQFHKVRMDAATTLQEAQKAADCGDLTAGRLELEKLLGQLQSAKKDSTFKQQLETLEMDVRSTVTTWADNQSYQSQGKKRAMLISKEHGMQRSQGLFAGKSSCMYSNRSQLGMSKQMNSYNHAMDMVELYPLVHTKHMM